MIFYHQGFPGSSDGKESAWNLGDLSSIPGSERSPGKGNGNPLQYSCLENPVDRGAWRATVHGFAESGMIEQLHFHDILQIWKTWSRNTCLMKWFYIIIFCTQVTVIQTKFFYSHALKRALGVTERGKSGVPIAPGNWSVWLSPGLDSHRCGFTESHWLDSHPRNPPHPQVMFSWVPLGLTCRSSLRHSSEDFRNNWPPELSLKQNSQVPVCTSVPGTPRYTRHCTASGWLGTISLFNLPALGLPWWASVENLCRRTWVRFLVQEDPTCWGATGPVCHTYWIWSAVGPTHHNDWRLRALGPMLCNKENPPQWEALTPQLATQE